MAYKQILGTQGGTERILLGIWTDNPKGFYLSYKFRKDGPYHRLIKYW